MVNVKTLKKILKGREMFPKLKVKKSGYNKFHKFHYYELEDLIPADNFLCAELNIITKYNGEDESCAKLEIIDLDQDPEQEIETFYTQCHVVNNGDATQGQQQKQSVQTYSRRSLYLQLWNISESNPIDASEIGLTTKIEVDKERVNELEKFKIDAEHRIEELESKLESYNSDFEQRVKNIISGTLRGTQTEIKVTPIYATNTDGIKTIDEVQIGFADDAIFNSSL